PLSAPVSTSAQFAEVRMLLTVVPLEVVSSLVPVNVTVAPLVRVGALLIAGLIGTPTSAHSPAPPLMLTDQFICTDAAPGSVSVVPQRDAPPEPTALFHNSL